MSACVAVLRHTMWSSGWLTSCQVDTKKLLLWAILGSLLHGNALRPSCRHVKVRSGFLVNRLLSQVDRWESIFTVFRDLEPLFDHINLSTALHRLARTSYKHRVRP